MDRVARLRVTVLVAAALAVLAALGFWRLSSGGSTPLTRAEVDRAVRSAISQGQQQQRNAPPDAVTAYRTILPSLVTVTGSTGAGADPDTGSPTAAPSPDPSAGTSAPASPRPPADGATPTLRAVVGTGPGLGAGVVVNASGAVLTALHVVAGSSRIEVTFADGTRSSARIASSDAATDIAVLAVAQLPGVVVPAVLGGVPGSATRCSRSATRWDCGTP